MKPAIYSFVSVVAVLSGQAQASSLSSLPSGIDQASWCGTTTVFTTVTVQPTGPPSPASTIGAWDHEDNEPFASSLPTYVGQQGSSDDKNSFGSGPTLLPAVHWDHPVDDLRQLDAPGNNTHLYYTHDGEADSDVHHTFASLNVTFQYDVVILDHSSFIKSTTCNKADMVVSFTTTEAYEYAYKSWSTMKEFMLATYTEGCGFTAEQRIFWLIGSVERQDANLSIVCHVVKQLAIEEALHGAEMVWGSYTPSLDATTGGQAWGGANNNTSASGGGRPGQSPTNSTSTPSGSSNSTSRGFGPTANPGSLCGSSPFANIDGFPTAACGDPSFDAALDQAIGFFDFSEADEAAELADFIPGYKANNTQLSARRAGLGKRGPFDFVGKAFKTVGGAIVGGAKAVGGAVLKTAGAALSLAGKAVGSVPVIGPIIKKVTEWDPSLNKGANFDFGPKQTAISPWGNAATIYEKESTSGKVQADVVLYCVNCGLKGHFDLHGQAKFNLVDLLYALNVGINANMEAGLNLGIVANAVYSEKKSKNLVSAPIPDLGVAVKGVFSAGCFIAVDAVAQLDIKAQGEAIIGATLVWPALEVNMNLINEGAAKQSGVTGFKPELRKIFEAKGTIAASTTLSLPVSLNVGIEIVPISWRKTVALIEEPGVTGKITAAGSTNAENPASLTCNNGIEFEANIHNDIKLDFFGVSTFNINHMEAELLPKTCKAIGASGSTQDADATPSPTTDNTQTGSAVTSGQDSPVSGSTGTGDQTSTSDASTETSSVGATDAGVSPSGNDVAATAAKSNVNSGVNSEATNGGEDAALSRAKPVSDSSAEASTGSILERRQSNDTFAATESSSNDIEVGDATEDPDNAEYLANSAAALQLADSTSDRDDVTYRTIVEYHNAFILIPGDDGNLYPGDVSSTQAAGLFGIAADNDLGGSAFTDDNERLLHYYPDVMAAYGASRIRFSTIDEIPKTSDSVVLRAVNYDDNSATPNPLFASNSAGDVFELVLCRFTNGATSKVFIVSGQQGLENLLLKKLRYTVTGNPVEACEPVALLFGPAA